MTPVIHVINKFDRRAGPDLLVAELLRKLDRDRWAPALFTIDFGRFEGPSWLEETLPDDIPHASAAWAGGKGLPNAILAFQNMRAKLGARVIHSHDIPSHLLSLPPLPRKGAARVASVHGIVDQTRRQEQWNAVMRRLLRRVDQTIVSSDYVRQALPALPDARVTQLMNAIDVTAFSPVDPQHLARPKSASDPLRLLCVARLSEEKGHRFLIEAMQHLRDEPVHLDILGTGPLQDQIERMARPLDNVACHGFVEDADPFFRKADVFVLPSIRESLSISVLEAMAWGLPVLTTDVGAHPKVVGESGAGWIAPRADPAALVHAIRDALATPETLPEYARAGHAHVHAAHSTEHFVRETERVYEAALSR